MTKKYKVFTLRNFETSELLMEHLNAAEIEAIKVVGNVLPFKVNNYVIDELIDWNNIPNDPIYQLTFPQKRMLSSDHYEIMKDALAQDLPKAELEIIANKIRLDLNPHPAGQQEKNVPMLGEQRLTGIQHKYRQTVLFFPKHSQTCHAYCTFCFRWPQFVGIDELKFAMQETDLLIEYLEEHTEVTDILFTGGDPMVMSADRFAAYINPILEANLPNIKTIRIGTKALGYWPYRFTTDRDAEKMLDLFKKITDKGIHLSIMAHFNHTAELSTEVVAQAIKNIKETGAQIRTQSPIMRYINDSSTVWSEMWQKQVELGCIPYYMFIARDTGAQNYFAVPLHTVHSIFQKAYQRVSGLARTVRGPSMSADPGKVQILGTQEINGEKVFVLRFIQGRNPNWVARPFFAKYDENAIWLDDLKPAFGENKFFFEHTELDKIPLHMN